MLFPSSVFLFVFLPVVLALYYGLPFLGRKWKNGLLLCASLFFYAWGEPVYVFLMLLCILFNWMYGCLLSYFQENKVAGKWILGFMVMTNLGILGYFKYSGFIITNINRLLHRDFEIPQIALPIGISFFTFQAMSYCIDVYRGKGKAQKNPLQVGLFISLFPQLIAGPIVRYETLADQIDHRKENWSDFSAGVSRFLMGLSKKVLLANNMAVLADAAFATPVSVLYSWMGAIAYTLQIYFDFSGYSDMAIGLGKMFGFHFEENFRYPYIAVTVSDFWRRWHISLQTWFRDYLYIPLGGNRVSTGRLVFNLFVVWGLTGLWHGARFSFIFWGLLYFVLLVFERFTGLYKYGSEKMSDAPCWIQKLPKFCMHIYTMLFVMLGWVFFRAESLGDGIMYVKHMFGIDVPAVVDSGSICYIKEYSIYILMAILFSLPVFPALENRFADRLWYKVFRSVVLILLFLFSISFVLNNAYNPFIYFNF